MQGHRKLNLLPRCAEGLRWLLVVAAVAVIERLLMAAFYPAVAYDDTPSYRHLAATILNHWQGYDGTRTPGYPIFLAWVGPDRWVYLLQLAMGLAIVLAFFWVGWQASGKARFGAAAALAHTLNLGQLFFEANLLTETLTTFLLALSVLAVFEALRRRGWLRLAWARAWQTSVAAEMVFGAGGGDGGLGWFLYKRRFFMEIPEVFAGLLAIVVIGMAVEYLLFSELERRTVARWHMVQEL